jgi:hypothetical protein
MVENHQAARFHPLTARLGPAVLIAAMIMATTTTLDAQTSETVRYTVRFPDPKTHYVWVEALLPTSGAAEVELFMPVWTPGSYLVREYGRTAGGLRLAARARSGLLI